MLGDDIPGHIIVSDFVHSFVFEDAQRPLHAHHIEAVDAPWHDGANGAHARARALKGANLLAVSTPVSDGF